MAASVFPLQISKESRLCRSVGAGLWVAGNAYTPAGAGYPGDAHTPANETADDTTWRRPSFPVDIGKSRLRRLVEAVNAYTPVEAGFASDAYTPVNEMADGTTWRPPSFHTNIGRKPAFPALPARGSRQDAGKNRLRR